MPAGRRVILQNYDALADSIAQSAMRRGPIPGITVDFIANLINYNEWAITSASMSGIAKALEAEVLGGKIEVRRAAPERAKIGEGENAVPGHAHLWSSFTSHSRQSMPCG